MGCPKLRNPFRNRLSRKQPRKNPTNETSDISPSRPPGACSTLQQVAQAPSQSDTSLAEDDQVASSSDSTILPRRNRKAQRRNLWQEAYNALDEKQRQNMNPVEVHEQSSDNHDVDSNPVCKRLDEVIQTVKAQYEIRMSKRGDSQLRDAASKILAATLSYKEIISAIVVFDPTGHASSAWTVVSLGLTMTQNYRDQQMAWFQSSAILTDTLARYAVVEKLYRDESSELNDKIEDAILRVYIAVIKYAAEAMTIYRSSIGKRLASNSVSVSKLLYDAKRFALKNIPMAKEFPLQLYSSGLVFAPEKCMVRNTFSHSIPPYFSQLPRVPQHWGLELQILETGSGPVDGLAFSPDGQTFLSSARTLQLWETSTGDLRKTLVDLPGNNLVNSTFSPDGKLVASGDDRKGTILLWDTLSGALKYALKGHSFGTDAIAFLSGELLISASRNGTLQMWNTRSGKLQQTIHLRLEEETKTLLWALNFSPDGYLLAGVQENRATINIWDTVKAELKHTLKSRRAKVDVLAISPDGQLLASGSTDGTLELWDICHSPVLSISASRNLRTELITFSPNDKLVASATYNEVTFWDTTSSEKQHAAEEHTVTTVQHSPTGAFLATGSRDGTVRLLDITGTVQRVLRCYTGRICKVSMSTGRLVASLSGQGTIDIWDASNGSLQHSLLAEYSGPPVDSLFSPDGNLLLSIWECGMSLWDTITGTCKWSLEGAVDPLGFHSMFSPDGRLIAFVNQETLMLRNTVNGSQHESLATPLNSVGTVTFSPSGDFLASSHLHDNTVRLWNIATGMEKRIFTDCSTDEVQFSPDGKLLASGSAWTGVKVWKVSDGTLRQTLERRDGPSWNEKVKKSDIYSWLLDTNRNEYMFHQKAQDNIISLTDEWIWLGEDRIVWLPPEYRAYDLQNTSTIVGNTVFVGCKPGGVVFIGIRLPSKGS
ncbi:hypothetical protein ASPBRDRAFT_30878 [Aspergillus brasiliensis CBS 101740]|uniref:Uncharacterized protein n=1 Tax=Aspergillus brasiliensis (strain CBS 101740 / IMI 381727 / IBT 21946) TaxID=767769 RepID=A0A1L9UHI6_ASPBC|nr:hypothetical protein ASPBRDRAFT_30878 [Aspergillus brasiliensis CBS 101740]